MVEMLFVIIIMLILASLVVSGLTGFSRARKVRNSIERVATALHVARSRAISDNAIYHIRIENRGPDNQWISIYRFPKASDALKAATENAVQSKISPPNMEVVEEKDALSNVIRAYPKPSGWTGPTTIYTGTNGWNPGSAQARPDSKNKGSGFWYSNYLVESLKLEQGTYFETTYSPVLGAKGLWDSFKGRPASTPPLHCKSDGITFDPGTLYYNPPTYYIALDDQNLLPKECTGAPDPQAVVLSFMPDGTASGPALLFIRDETNLGWVQVWKGGLIRSGDITAQDDFTTYGL
jgi:type II secretory pathway pseudopilin PulG